MRIAEQKPSLFLLYVIALQVIVCITIILDIPFAQQVLGVLFFTFIPGFAILRTLKQEKFNIVEKILFSAGLSLAFLMLIGILINELGTSKLILEPLSTGTLSIILNITITLLFGFSYIKNRGNFNSGALRNLPVNISLAALPIFSVIGVVLVLGFGNNILLISVTISIAILFLILLFKSSFSTYYPVAIVCIALALLLSATLVSRYMYGDDIQLEFNVFLATKNASLWNWQSYNFFGQYLYNSMASITILPTIFSNLLSIEAGWIFKLLFPILFSLVPLGLYRLYQKQWDKKVAFMSVIFFMANYEFVNVPTQGVRTIVGQLFYVLLFLVLLKKDWTDGRSKWIIFMFSIFALVVSHYSLTYIFLFVILSTWLLGKTFLKNKNLKINSVILALSFCLTFLWYMYIAYGAFYGMSAVLGQTLNSFISEFFNLGSRGATTLAGLGFSQPSSILHSIGGYIHRIAELFIIIGFVSLIMKWKREKFDSEYFLLIFVNMIFLLSAIIVPGFSNILQMGRLYEITLLFLSPLFVLGGEALFKKILSLSIKKEKKKEIYSTILISIVLVVFFFFRIGLVYEIADDPVPSSISLSLNKMQDNMLLIHESEAFCAMWLSKYGNVEEIMTYSDGVAYYHVLMSYSTINASMMDVISNTTIINQPSYTYLGWSNVMKGIVIYDTSVNPFVQFNMSELPIFNSSITSTNRVYSNGASEIYYSTP